jgi:hypothetical protein
MKMLDPIEAEQIVLDEMDGDAASHQGPRTIRHKIAMRTGKHLPRDYISDIMHIHDPEGFAKRDPMVKRIHREPKVPLGINERWSADGHDKLNGIGFPVWAIVDDAVGKWLGVWVVPSNRLGNIIAYLYLEAVESAGGTSFRLLSAKLADCRRNAASKYYGLWVRNNPASWYRESLTVRFIYA